MLSVQNKEQYSRNLEEYNKDGFTVFRNVIDPELIAEARDHLLWLREKFPEFRPEHLHHPLMRDDAFWVRLVTDSRLLDIAELFLGPDLACFTAHYICKPPRDGQAVLWHQDGAYWKLSPMEATSLWLAVDESTAENGCLRVVPGTHKLPLQKLVLRDDTPNLLMSSMEDRHVDINNAVNIELQPGDVSVHHPNVIHGSDPNRSSKRRCGLDIAFIGTSTAIESEGLYLNPILVRGAAVPGINQYRAWPSFDADTSMRFAGCESWTHKSQEVNARHPEFVPSRHDDEPVQEIVRRMLARLKSGTTKELRSEA
ncbi:phytanoyl-CoA dioxygenase family protein [Burkholderia ubonensis]|uniref:phytanoyl-CoA dioxygenase family protein n=1 Tax=Burkholderia ubonensis TaxID=101571 RepID=UPI00075DBFF9|nr:phytanoyl-CoA dioxygenase family protein [Burkholderia ubonensis]AOK62320.1 phytanoyl-CoA dioxygenase [Burkholderia ubonensis]KVS40482.1 phytanoyl-CoA dioxygenase [Burkholderia ubonensis]KVS51102.1 phytanoyl-CoA dioxygenase [Burkholderia ubonensis]KVS76107.1 phytanoyl-CoA dioxygenase [Burkholderia ubonensis]KVS78345.1 phytanoyl-CoA dioxygenase [Burkholderia ubonensis]